MNSNFAIRGVFSILLAFGCGACQSVETDHSGDLGTSAVQFQDLAVPAGMKLVERFHESHSREAGGWRYGHFEYVGQTTLQEACSHLLDRMPQHGWAPVVDDASQATVRRLQFKRGSYVVDYRLERIDGETHMVIDYDTKVDGR
ncbi:MAG: hypothetical protein ABL997_03450 [Planctomycetota bacterium]